MLSIHKRLHQSFDPSKVNFQHLKNFHNLNGIKTAAESQLESNNHVLKSLKNKLKSVSNETTESEDIEQFTKLDDGFINKHNLPKYISLAKYNDKPFMVPQLKHNLQSTLFSPGSHFLCDPRTRFCNFDQSLTTIPHIDDFKMDKISNFTPSSRDNKLLKIASEVNKLNKTFENKNSHYQDISYYSSTSSMTSVLIKFHKLLSKNRPINTTSFSKIYPDYTNFSMTSDLPTSVIVTPKNDDASVFSVDADRVNDTEITLSVLGNALELMLTKTPKEFEKYLKSSTAPVQEDKSAYHYARIGKFLVRSQLDAIDTRLPGTGTFDIKTRAVCAIRFDIEHTDYFPTNYEINKNTGLFESFERELFDAARIVMFKYSLQARLGNMDGIFMAFHNIKKFLGFQYLPLSQIDNYFFGEHNIDNQRYRASLFKKRKFERTFDRNNNDAKSLKETKNSKEIEQVDDVSVSNQELLHNIVDDFGNHFQTKREALSTFMADRELEFSMNLMQKLLDNIVKDTKGKPFRILFKRMKTSDIRRKVSVDTTTDEEVTNKNSKVEIQNDTTEQDDVVNEKPEHTEKIEEKSNDKDEIQYSIVAVVNTLEANTLKESQLLSDEKLTRSTSYTIALQNEKHPQKPSDKIKFFTKYASEFKSKYYALNRHILKDSLENGFFAYEIQAEHLFNGENASGYPTPPLDILEKNTQTNWDLRYSINKINRMADKIYLYMKFIKDIGTNVYRRADVDPNHDVYNEDGTVKLDVNATPIQNVTRAYSAKAKKREAVFKSNKK